LVSARARYLSDRAESGREMKMLKDVDKIQQLGKPNVDTAMKSFGAMSKRFQAIAVELANYSKESLDNHVATTEKFMGAKSLEKGVRGANRIREDGLEGFVAHATKIGELYFDRAKELYKPIEGVIGRKPFAS